MVGPESLEPIVNDLLQHGNCAGGVTGGAQPRRDVDKDLERGRIYLPADELAAYDVDRDVLMWCHTNRRTDARVRRVLIEQHAETRRIYGYAHQGVSQVRAPISTLRGGCAYPLLGNLGLHADGFWGYPAISPSPTIAGRSSTAA